MGPPSARDGSAVEWIQRKCPFVDLLVKLSSRSRSALRLHVAAEDVFSTLAVKLRVSPIKWAIAIPTRNSSAVWSPVHGGTCGHELATGRRADRCRAAVRELRDGWRGSKGARPVGEIKGRWG
jgi:hypothetical protein